MSILYQSNRSIEMDLDFRMIELSRCQYLTNQIELSTWVLGVRRIDNSNDPVTGSLFGSLR